MAKQNREAFGSRIGVILAMAGSAIGLGNLWRFPYVTGQNGGAAFVLIYIASTLLVALPVFMAEVIIGRRSRSNASHAMEKLSGNKKFWKFSGALAVFIPLFIASYYSVIGGWSMGYTIMSVAEPFVKMAPDKASNLFAPFVSNPWMPLAMHLVFLGLCCAIVSGGVKSGIEKFSKFTLPALFVLILIIIAYSITLPGAREGIEYLIEPSFSDITPKSFVYALGQSFYSLSLGMGTIITYGSYIKKEDNLLTEGIGTAVSDLVFAILAGLAIMPAVFAAGIEPSSGPGLIFESIPFVFCKMGADIPVISSVMSFIFFFAVVIAAMTSCISLIEVGVGWLVEKYNLSRKKASKCIFALCAVLGSLCSLSFGPLSNISIEGENIFGAFDYVASNILLMVLAFITVIFVGFALKKEDVRDEFTNNGTLKLNSLIFNTLYFLIKWVAPLAVLLIFITNFVL